MCWPRITLQKTKSTNLLARDLLKAGLPSPFVVRAYEQEEGKGRYGHTWFSPRGGVWLSLAHEDDLKSWTFYSTLALMRATKFLTQSDLSSSLEIKLPNDLLFNRKKIGGILGEQHRGKIIIGIGWNVSIRDFPEELKNIATSISIETGRDFPVEVASDILIFELVKLSDELQRYPQKVFEEWRDKVGDVGKRIKFRIRGMTREGILSNITPGFQIILKGREEPIDLFQLQDLERVK